MLSVSSANPVNSTPPPGRYNLTDTTQRFQTVSAAGPCREKGKPASLGRGGERRGRGDFEGEWDHEDDVALAELVPGRSGVGPDQPERLPDVGGRHDPAERALPGTSAAILPALATVHPL